MKLEAGITTELGDIQDWVAYVQPPLQLGVLIVNILISVKLIAVENSPTNLEIYGQEGKSPRCDTAYKYPPSEVGG